jgi:hypothetical protein
MQRILNVGDIKMPANVLTDRQLAELYFGLARHYKECKERNLPAPAIYNELVNGVYYTLNHPQSTSPLKNLPETEKSKVFNVLNSFFYSTPEYRQVPRQYQGRNFFNDGLRIPVILIREDRYTANYYRRDDDFLFRWMLINELTNRPYYRRHGYNDSSCWGGGGGTHSHSKEDNKKNGDAMAYLLLLLIAAAVAACAFVAAYYLFSKTFDGLERIFCSEGAFQGLMSLLSMAVTTTASTLLASTFASSSIYALALSAGVSNPLGWVTFCVLGLGLVGGALGTFVADQVHEYIIKQNNQDALDPQDPSRFALTAQEAKALTAKGIDPIKVKCAIVALRAEMGDKPVPSLLNRWFFSSDTQVQDNLSLVRKLRSGAIDRVRVGDMFFNCRFDALFEPVAPLASVGQPQPFEASAPTITQPAVNPNPVLREDPPPRYEDYQYDYPSTDEVNFEVNASEPVPGSAPPEYAF